MKFYEQTWFMWLMLVLFFPVGLFLLWKYSQYQQKTKMIITGLFLILVFISFNNKPSNVANNNNSQISKTVETPVNLEEVKMKEQEAFKAWYPTVESNLKDFDQVWGYWKTTMDNLGSGKIGRHQAYADMKKISAGMDNVSSRIRNNKVPDALSKKHKEEIQSGISSLSSAAYYRQKAAEDMMEILDNGNFKPSELDDVKTTIQMSEGEMIKGVAHIIGVQSELGLLDKESK